MVFEELVEDLGRRDAGVAPAIVEPEVHNRPLVHGATSMDENEVLPLLGSAAMYRLGFAS